MYRRFDLDADAPVSIADIKLDEWKNYPEGENTLTKIDHAVEQYVNQQKVQTSLRECAERLVEIRRERQATERWERFAMNFQYQCKEKPACEAKDDVFGSRLELRQHLIRKHGMVWQVPCRRNDGSVAHPFSCYWDQCGEETTTVFDHEQDFLEHLRNSHSMPNPQLKTRREIEARLDEGREIGTNVAPNPKHQRTKTFYNE
jgi:hypothetical protein